MTREQLKAFFPDITDELMTKVLDINTADIEKAKGKASDKDAEITKLNGEVTKLSGELATSRQAIKDLEAAKGDSEALQAEIDKYKLAEENRIKDEAAANARADIAKRFDAALGDKAFAHDYIRNGVLADFEKALADEANKGKGDADIFTALTKDKDGIFMPQSNGGTNMGGFGNGGSNSKQGENPFAFNFSGVRALEKK